MFPIFSRKIFSLGIVLALVTGFAFSYFCFGFLRSDNVSYLVGASYKSVKTCCSGIYFHEFNVFENKIIFFGNYFNDKLPFLSYPSLIYFFTGVGLSYYFLALLHLVKNKNADLKFFIFNISALFSGVMNPKTH